MSYETRLATTPNPITASTAQSARPKLHSIISAGSPLIADTEHRIDIKSAVEQLSIEFVSIQEELTPRLQRRTRDFAEPVRIVNGDLLINEDAMIMGVPYDISWDGEHLQILRTLDGRLEIVAVVD